MAQSVLPAVRMKTASLARVLALVAMTAWAAGCGDTKPAQSSAASTTAAPGTIAVPRSPLSVGQVTSTTISSVGQLPSSAPSVGEYRVHNIDVGTGLSILIQGADFTLLYDGGSMDDREVIDHGGNQDRLLSYLFAAIGPSGPAVCTPSGDSWQATDRPRLPINYLFLSHPHDDHVAMLADVVRCYQVGQVFDPGDPYASAAYANFLSAIATYGAAGYHTNSSIPAEQDISAEKVTIPTSIPWTLFNENDTVALGAGASLKILHANGAPFPDDANMNSTVVRVQLGPVSMLLTGDAESGAREDPSANPGAIEAALLQDHASDLKVDIWQVGHHGSMTSNRQAFIDAISPTWALIGAGPQPYSGDVLPDAPVIQVITALVPTTILRTDVHDAAMKAQGASGCPSADRIGVDNDQPGGCDNYLLDIVSSSSGDVAGGGDGGGGNDSGDDGGEDGGEDGGDGGQQ